MYVSSLSFGSFRNYTHQCLTFRPGVVCVYGPNGAGKTNLLDAIHYVCSARSAFLHEEEALLKRGETCFKLQAQVCERDRTMRKLSVSYTVGQRKVLQVEGKVCPRRRDYALHLPVCMFSAADSCLIQGGSQERRDFMDSILLQEDNSYQSDWIAYRAYLRNRNAALKAPLGGARVDRELILSYDDRMIPLSERIAARRARFVEEYAPLFQKRYAALAGTEEKVDCLYSSEALSNDFGSRYRASLEEDMRLMRTRMGIHRDDYLFKMKGEPLRRYASQGQQKTFLWALKLAYVERIAQLRSRTPILLLDDVLDKLDRLRTARLFELLFASLTKSEEVSASFQLFLSMPELPEASMWPCSREELHVFRIESGHIYEE